MTPSDRISCRPFIHVAFKAISTEITSNLSKQQETRLQSHRLGLANGYKCRTSWERVTPDRSCTDDVRDLIAKQPTKPKRRALVVFQRAERRTEDVSFDDRPIWLKSETRSSQPQEIPRFSLLWLSALDRSECTHRGYSSRAAVFEGSGNVIVATTVFAQYKEGLTRGT